MSRTVLLAATLRDGEEAIAAAGGALPRDVLVVTPLSLDRLRGFRVDVAFATAQAQAHPRFAAAAKVVQKTVTMSAPRLPGGTVRIA